MKRFHKSIQSNYVVKEKLESKFKEVKELFHEITEFKDFRDSLIDDFSGFLKTMTHKLAIDFEAYNPVNFFHALRLQVEEDNNPRSMDELGTGEEQLLTLAFAHAYAKAFHEKILLAIEEPECSLHPLVQDYLSKKIHNMAKEGLPVIITTHNPTFINMQNMDGICLVRKDKENGTVVTQLNRESLTAYCHQHHAPASKVRENNIAEFYQANSTKQIFEGFFAKKIILVEGQTETMALPIYFNALNFNLAAEGVSVIPVFGKGNLAKWWRLFTAYNIPVYVIFDNDSENDENALKRKDILKTLGDSENQFDSLLNSAEIRVTDRYAIFGKDFETSLRSLFLQYSQFEKEANEMFDSSAKPFITRYVAEKLSNSECNEPGWERLVELKDKIMDLNSTRHLDGLMKNEEDRRLYDSNDLKKQ